MKKARNINNVKNKILECVNDSYNNGYTQGYEDGYAKACETELKDEKGYQRGLRDAWKCVEKLFNIGAFDRLHEIFGYQYAVSVVSNFTPEEAIERLNNYEKNIAEIHIGDVVYNLDPQNERIVTAIYDDDFGKRQVVQMCHNGKFVVDRIDNLTLTKKHFGEITKVLDQMRATNEQND